MNIYSVILYLPLFYSLRRPACLGSNHEADVGPRVATACLLLKELSALLFGFAFAIGGESHPAPLSLAWQCPHSLPRYRVPGILAQSASFAGSHTSAQWSEPTRGLPSRVAESALEEAISSGSHATG